jgi:hypothetical protein
MAHTKPPLSFLSGFSLQKGQSTKALSDGLYHKFNDLVKKTTEEAVAKALKELDELSQVDFGETDWQTFNFPSKKVDAEDHVETAPTNETLHQAFPDPTVWSRTRR